MILLATLFIPEIIKNGVQSQMLILCRGIEIMKRVVFYFLMKGVAFIKHGVK
jgi:hypothetical protein